MKILTQSLLLTALCCVTGLAAADTPNFDVLQSMSVAQFRAAGLDKLSDAQLKALDTWFAQYEQEHGPCAGNPAAPAAAPPPAAPAMAAAAPAATPARADAINAHIVGDFNGWRGATRFTLDNGQVWEQTDDGIVTLGHLTNPKVTISRGLFNAYYMSVEGVREVVQVKRVRP